MTVGIAVRDDVGITHWAQYSEKPDRINDSGRAIMRELQRVSRPKLKLTCEYGRRTPQVNQVRRVSTLITSVTCMACIMRI